MSNTTKRKKKNIFSTAMKIPPKKPHFFKPILPGFKHGLTRGVALMVSTLHFQPKGCEFESPQEQGEGLLGGKYAEGLSKTASLPRKIPRGFLKYLKGHEDIEHAVLRRVSKQWQVKVNGRRLEDGWEKFAEEHDLQLGDLLVFRHEGNMEFEVSIFDSSHCDREYSEYLQQEEEEEEANNVEETSKNLEFEERPSPSIELSDHAEAATHKPFGHSSFVCTIKPYCLTYGFLYVPKHFASANGFKTNKKCSLIIKDERQNSWTLRLSCCKKSTLEMAVVNSLLIIA
ncbi:B3 domain-containing protein REM10-like isoform X2 [Nicotiana sylvestris]|uniref:B3 domain-containing protein REM10-like isoform X2 n=1 Tax=Nicotiana sylvestris TaxID=4096 RepID=A0A1U7YIZ6_NICSY|nr:PREDICTED: B3 domain-containing protein REM10-like isoform X2 [Nicotiana sylvestris]